jgi:hypothetical protein
MLHFDSPLTQEYGSSSTFFSLRGTAATLASE